MRCKERFLGNGRATATTVRAGVPQRVNVHPLVQLSSLVGNHACAQLLRPKLTISQAGAVMRTPEPSASEEPTVSGQERLPQVQRLGAEREEERVMRKSAEEEEDQEAAAGTIRTKTISGAAPQLSHATESNVAMSGRSGPLPDSVRSFSVPRFDYVFVMSV